MLLLECHTYQSLVQGQSTNHLGTYTPLEAQDLESYPFECLLDHPRIYQAYCIAPHEAAHGTQPMGLSLLLQKFCFGLLGKYLELTLGLECLEVNE